MRVYAGERDPNGRARVWFSDPDLRPDIGEVVETLSMVLSYDTAVSVGDAERDDLLARHQRLLDFAGAAEPVPLLVGGGLPADQFTWGGDREGSLELAAAILAAEIGHDAPPELCRRFRDDVIASFPSTEQFRLPADVVDEWLETTAEVSIDGDVGLPVHSPVVPPADVAEVAPLEPGESDDERERREASGSRVVAACETAWRDIQSHHPELPDVVVVLGSGVERGRLVKLGHWWGGRWIADGQARGEVLLAGEALHLPADQVFEVLLHEAAHGLNAARGVKDTSRGGRYHNRKFAETAKEVLLDVNAMPPYGLAATTLTDDSRERYAETIALLDAEIHIAREIRGLRIGNDAEVGADGQTAGASGSDGQTKSRSAVAASCGCGRKMRMAPSVFEQGPVACGNCGTEFTTGAEAEPAGRGEAVVDTTFVDRRQRAVEAERQATELREVIEQKKAHIEATLRAAGAPDHLGLEPLRQRHRILAALLEHFGHPTTRAALDVGDPGADWDGADQAAAEAAAVLTSAAAEPRLGPWYESMGAAGEPMPATDEADARRLTELARALLVADGTISGPTVYSGERPFQAGDRVIVTDLVPNGPDIGILGTVTTADPEDHRIEVDFPIWGSVVVSGDAPLARALDHDYAAAVDLSAEQPTREALDLELERLGAGAGAEW